jgi:amidase
MISHDDLCFTSAGALARLLRERKVSAHEVMAAHLDRIGRFNGALNAIVARLDDDRCLALASEADQRLASGSRIGPLHGLPIAFKDLESAIGFPVTLGSPIFARTQATVDTLIVERLRAAGAIPIGKTNVPEFGMGSHTFNAVFGATVNPWNVSKTAGGSSGGAAAALAAGLLPLADGSDLGGSLRNPANFNNVVGFRPSVGLVPTAPDPLPFLGYAVKGPLARSVSDAAFLLSVMAGDDPRDPGCYASDPSIFAGSLDRSLDGIRIAWCPDLGGLPLDPRIRPVVDSHRRTFEDLGCSVEEISRRPCVSRPS